MQYTLRSDNFHLSRYCTHPPLDVAYSGDLVVFIPCRHIMFQATPLWTFLLPWINAGPPFQTCTE